MELNGIANILAVVEIAKESSQIDSKVADQIIAQCDILERYLVAVSECHRANKSVPYWHEVRDNTSGYRKNAQRGT